MGATPVTGSVNKAFKVLWVLQSLEGKATVAAISKQAKLPVATTHRLLLTLSQLGAVTHGPDGYQLGFALSELAQHVPEVELLRATARSHLRRVAQATGLAVHLGRFDGEMVHYLVKEDAAPSGDLPTFEGCRLEAYCSAIGKLILANQPTEVIERYLLNGPFVRLTASTITAPDALRAEFADARARGYAVDNCEIYENLRCIAVPLRTPRAAFLAALSAAGPADRMSDAALRDVRGLLDETAAAIVADLYPTPLGGGRALRV